MSSVPASVQVVIVNYQRPQETLDCLRSVFASRDVEIEVVVVDNGSGPSSCAVLLDAHPAINLISLDRNRGFAGGYNAGILQALSRPTASIFLLNNDAVVEPDTIATLLFTQGWDITVPKIMFQDASRRIWAAGARWRRFPPSVQLIGYGQIDRGQFDEQQTLAYATGCALMVRREVFERVGGFDEAYENYAEDYDFCFRVRQAGFTIGYVPHARVHHKVSQTLGEASPGKWRYLGQNTVLFYRKRRHLSLFQLWTFLLWVTVRETWRGQSSVLPYFWQGVRSGFRLLKTTLT